MVTAAAVQCGQTDGCATAFCASWAASARAEDRTAARRPMAAAAEPRDTVFAAGRCHAGHRPLAAAAAVCYAPGRLIEKDAGPECILGHAGAVVHGRLGVQRWEQPGRRMSPLREEPSRGSLKGPPSRSRTRPPFQPEVPKPLIQARDGWTPGSTHARPIRSGVLLTSIGRRRP
ncbi:uncharacterized protein LOC125537501 isoform X9 [Triticum urartu]|uniref:uncharacterized protein LOC125537501 isoform X9 n=1 Tax=Triticum urartu TaxID=4572 RepID=UPI0020438D76|nr:uncharacterized protein LOC125537501 isoform X9 [Triticum urartu]